MTTFHCKPDNKCRSEAIAHIANMRDDKEFVVTIRDGGLSKTDAQRRYFHQIVGILSKETGHDTEFFKTRFCYTSGYMKEYAMKDGTTILQRKSTETLTKEEYSQLIDMAIETCQIMGFEYPDARFYGYDI